MDGGTKGWRKGRREGPTDKVNLIQPLVWGYNKKKKGLEN